MKITLTFDSVSPEEMQALAHVIGGLGLQKPVETTAPKAAPKTAPKAAPKTTPAAPAPAQPAGPTISEVRAALSQKVEKHRDEIKAKLSELGAANVSTLAPEKYGEMLDYLNGLD